jgi:hypothetical protein
MDESVTAATLTPAAAGADLLDQLRQLVQRHDRASRVEEVRQLCDEVTAVLRRTRGRISRLAKVAAEQAAPKAKATPKPAAEAKRAEPKPEQKRAVPAKPSPQPRAAVKLQRDPKPQQPPKSPKDAPRKPLPLRGPRSWWTWLAAALLNVLAVLGAVGNAVRARVVKWSRRTWCACRSAARRLAAIFRWPQ